MEPTALQSRAIAHDDYHARAARAGAVGRWSAANEALPWKPEPRSKPYHWSYAALRPLATEAAEFVRADQGALRVLTLLNPGHPDHEAAAGNLYSGLQLLVPGEDMHSHRHAATAVRYVHESVQGWTAVDGEKMYVAPGDVVLTPAMHWHEHGNDGSAEVVWQDCTDDPLVTMLAANLFELHPTRSHLGSPMRGGESEADATLRPSREPHPPGIFLYPWSKTRERVAEALEKAPHAEIRLTGATGRGDLSPTVAAWFLGVRARCRTPRRRQTGATVLITVRGQATVHVGDTEFTTSQGDTVAVPSWASWYVDNPADSAAVLFAYDESPPLRAAGLYRTGSTHEGPSS